MLTLLLVAFLAGIATIAAPCVLPILPVVLSAGATGGKRRPLGTATGLVVSFGSAVLLLALLVQRLSIPTDAFRWLSAAILLFFGLVLAVPAFGSRIEVVISRFASRFAPDTSVERDGFWSGFLLGISLGLVWTPCAGPILAIVVTQAANAQISAEVVFISFTYALGAGIPLFLIATLGQRLRQVLMVAKRNIGRIQQVFGIIILIQAALIFTGLDLKLQTQIVKVVPPWLAEGLTTRLEERVVNERE
jgi:cytochrome c biogenesis protein CcdA